MSLVANSSSVNKTSSGQSPAPQSSGDAKTAELPVIEGTLESSSNSSGEDSVGDSSGESSGDSKNLLGFDAWEKLGEDSSGEDSEEVSKKATAKAEEKGKKSKDETEETPNGEEEPDKSEDSEEVEGSEDLDGENDLQEKVESGEKSKAARVLDGLNSKEARAFKRMSNEAYNLLYPEYLRMKKESGEKDQKINELAAKALAANKEFYAHEHGYRLSPEYAEKIGMIQGLSTEADHWRDQLMKVEAGEEWEDLGRDKDGNYFITARYPATPQNKIILQERLMNTNRIKDSTLEQLQGLKTGHKQRYDKAVEGIEQKRVEVFPESKDENHPGWKVAKEVINTFIPEEFRNHPLAKSLGFAGYKLLEFQRMLKAKLDGEKTKKVLKSDEQKQTAIKGASGPKAGVKKELNWDQMKGYLESRE